MSAAALLVLAALQGLVAEGPPAPGPAAATLPSVPAIPAHPVMPAAPADPAMVEPAPGLMLRERAPRTTLEAAVEAFRRLWIRADSDALVSELAAERIRLDLGGGREGLLGRRQARAALRDFLSPFETVALDVGRISEVGGSPPRGFAELVWTARAAGTDEPLRYTLFAGFVREGTTWRLQEIRILR